MWCGQFGVRTGKASGEGHGGGEAEEVAASGHRSRILRKMAEQEAVMIRVKGHDQIIVGEPVCMVLGCLGCPILPTAMHPGEWLTGAAVVEVDVELSGVRGLS